jgi:hypothetical protein
MGHNWNGQLAELRFLGFPPDLSSHFERKTAMIFTLTLASVVLFLSSTCGCNRQLVNKNVIIVTRLLCCSRRVSWNKKKENIV